MQYKSQHKTSISVKILHHQLACTLAFPMTIMPNLARVRATFNRRGSLRNPTPWCSFDLTHDNTMKSFSRPWNASTLATSISYTGHITLNKSHTYVYQLMVAFTIHKSDRPRSKRLVRKDRSHPM